MRSVPARDRPPKAVVPRWRGGDEVGSVAALLRRGGVLAIPTESSYGLAVDPLNAAAVRALFELKGRPPGSPLPVVVASPRQLARLGIAWPTKDGGGLERLWPAALSLLLPTSFEVPAAAGSGRLAVRVPAHEGLRRLLERLGIGVTATSANASGAPPILEPDELEPLLAGHDAMIADAGELAGGAPSTLVSVKAGVAAVVRPGRVSREELQRAAPGLELVSPPEIESEGEAFSAASVEIPVEETS